MALLKKITKKTRHRKSSLQTTPRSPRSQARIHPSCGTSFRHLILLFTSTSIQEPCSLVGLASGHTPPLAYPKPHSRLDPLSGLTLPPDHPWCLLLTVRLRWHMACPLFLSPMITSMQSSNRTITTILTVNNNVKATFGGGHARHASVTSLGLWVFPIGQASLFKAIAPLC